MRLTRTRRRVLSEIAQNEDRDVHLRLRGPELRLGLIGTIVSRQDRVLHAACLRVCPCAPVRPHGRRAAAEGQDRPSWQRARMRDDPAAMTEPAPPTPPLRPPPGPERPANPVWRWVAVAVGVLVVTVGVVGAFGGGKDKPGPAATATSPTTEAEAAAATTTTATPATERPAPTTSPPTASTTTMRPPAAPPPRPAASKKPAFSGVERTVYDTAEGVCEGIGLKEMARQLHVAADPLDVATANAKGVQPVYQAAAIAGCRAGLKKHG